MSLDQAPKKEAKALIKMEIPVILIGDFNIIPTELDVYKPEKWVNNALFRIEARKSLQQLIAQRWTDAIKRLFPDQQVFTFGIIFRKCLWTECWSPATASCSVPKWHRCSPEGGIDRNVRGAGKVNGPTMRLFGSGWIKNKVVNSPIAQRMGRDILKF